MAEEGTPFTGILYAGLIATADGPKVIEFNARFGDPETEVVLPKLTSDLGAGISAILDGETPEFTWDGVQRHPRRGHRLQRLPGERHQGVPVCLKSKSTRIRSVYYAGVASERAR